MEDVLAETEPGRDPTTDPGHLTAELLTLTTSQAAAAARPVFRARLSAHPLVSQRSRLRAHLDVSHQGGSPP